MSPQQESFFYEWLVNALTSLWGWVALAAIGLAMWVGRDSISQLRQVQRDHMPREEAEQKFKELADMQRQTHERIDELYNLLLQQKVSKGE